MTSWSGRVGAGSEGRFSLSASARVTRLRHVVPRPARRGRVLADPRRHTRRAAVTLIDDLDGRPAAGTGPAFGGDAAPQQRRRGTAGPRAMNNHLLA